MSGKQCERKGLIQEMESDGHIRREAEFRIEVSGGGDHTVQTPHRDNAKEKEEDNRKKLCIFFIRIYNY